MTLDTREQSNGFSLAFQSLFFSANSIFRRRSSHDKEGFKASPNSYNGIHIKPGYALPVMTSGGDDGCDMFSLSNTVDEKQSACSPYCTLSPLPISRSDSSITVDSNVSSMNDYVTPTFSPLQSSINDYDDISEPWRLTFINKGNIEENYFFMDRDDGDSSSVNEYSERDRFGFKIPTQWIKTEHFNQFDTYYQPIVDKQCNDWDQLLSEHEHQLPSLSSQLKKCVRNGIPNELRGKVWMHYSGAYSKLNTNPELYDSLVNTANNLGELNEYAEIIRRDLHRTFPDNSEFSCDTRYVNGSVLMIPETNSKLQSLQNVLLAFSIYSPHIGYCQSLNYLVGFFLLFLEEKEAFWMLAITINDYFPEKMYDITMDGANLDQAVLLQYIHEKMPSVWNKISNGKSFEETEKDGLPPITLVTSHWFLTLFINILPIETVLRIWDCFFVEGYSVMFRVALSLIKMNEERIKNLKDPIEIFQVLQNMPRRLIDCHNFMDYVFSDDNVFNDITTEQIESRRSIIRNNHSKKQQKNV